MGAGCDGHEEGTEGVELGCGFRSQTRVRERVRVRPGAGAGAGTGMRY